jgi:CheY-like chemotaxis protein
VSPGIILSVDDNEDDQLLLQRAFRKNASSLDLRIVGDGEKAIEYLGGFGEYQDRELFPIPGIILLDLKMPRKNGLEVLDWMNRESLIGRFPVAVFTSSKNEIDIQCAYDLGARWYVIKPVDFTALTQWIHLLGRWFQNSTENDLSDSPHYRPPSP